MVSSVEQFPHIVTEKIMLRKIEESGLEKLFEIYSNKNIFKYIPGDVIKNKTTVLNMIGHFERDYKKGKTLFLGIFSPEAPDELVGVAEIFDFDNKVNMVTIGYRINENYWHMGFATETVGAMVDYLFRMMGMNRIQAFVMPENKHSHRVLLKNKFDCEGVMRQAQYWKGRGVIDVAVYSLLCSDMNANGFNPDC